MATIKNGKRLESAILKLAFSGLKKPAKVRVGFLETATYPDGTSVAMGAAINEYGKPPTQPPRPFFRNMVKDKSKEWPKAIAGLLKANGMDAAKTLDLVGAAIAGQLRQSIIDLWSPPLAASTIRRKGFDKPLIDTGHMLNSVDHEVEA